jgi:hypothetical protein
VTNKTVNDKIAGKNAVTISNSKFAKDRFGVANGALLANSTWQLPAGIYFHGDFTFTAWLKKNECTDNKYGYYF